MSCYNQNSLLICNTCGKEIVVDEPHIIQVCCHYEYCSLLLRHHRVSHRLMTNYTVWDVRSHFRYRYAVMYVPEHCKIYFNTVITLMGRVIRRKATCMSQGNHVWLCVLSNSSHKRFYFPLVSLSFSHGFHIFIYVSLSESQSEMQKRQKNFMRMQFQNDIHWHADERCFCCNGCGKNLLGKKYSFTDKKLYCGTDANCGKRYSKVIYMWYFFSFLMAVLLASFAW